MRPKSKKPPLFDLEAVGPQLERVLNGSLAFGFCFQPIVDLHRGVTVGYEALVRFPKEVGLAPDIAFRAAEEWGIRLEMEEMVTRQALSRREKLPPNCFLSVNVSPFLLLSDRWDAILEDSADLTRFVLEITEQDVVEDYITMRDRIAVIRSRGGSVAVDDAGAGYASLKHTMELKPNFLKLDRYFTGECHADAAKATLIEMIGKAANRMDSWIVGEGVETNLELDELIRLNVPLGQGYFLGRPAPEMNPLPADKTAAILARAQSIANTEDVVSTIEPCHICFDRQEAEVYFQDNAHRMFAMVVDSGARPIELFERHPLLGKRSLLRMMKVQASSAPEEVLHRALMRSPAERFDMLAIINERGAFQGIVRIDRLMRTLLDSSGSNHRIPHDRDGSRVPPYSTS